MSAIHAVRFLVTWDLLLRVIACKTEKDFRKKKYKMSHGERRSLLPAAISTRQSEADGTSASGNKRMTRTNKAEGGGGMGDAAREAMNFKYFYGGEGELPGLLRKQALIVSGSTTGGLMSRLRQKWRVV